MKIIELILKGFVKLTVYHFLPDYTLDVIERQNTEASLDQMLDFIVEFAVDFIVWKCSRKKSSKRKD